ncbi:MAG: NADPH-dependent assimilatory sulfite reductase hemoprotein subunit [Actinomycetota bacterium]|nr:NADPH-dependent assimilatory sulfite reductase hemoprotein subunit [Actinomycetota bacterium]
MADDIIDPVAGDRPALSGVERVKEASLGLRGNLAEELAADTERFSPDSTVVLKFHGIYQQDDRDVRTERKRQGLDVDTICMVRVAIPGGVLTAEQYLAMDELCEAVGNATLRITTRQGLQYHFVRKGDLERLIATLNRHLVTTLAACGDVVRNTMCCPAPLPDRGRAAVQDYARRVATRFRPKTDAYWQLWVGGERAVSAEVAGHDPLYGTTYLPRKFKIGFAFPGDNCVDVYTNDLGVVPLLDDDGAVRAFTVLVGGGMGKNHTDPTTFPRLADPLATVAPHELLEVIEAVIVVQRDNGNRADRDHARLKYLVHNWGLPRFRAEVERRLGRALPPAEPIVLEASDDHLGWHPQGDGRWFLGVKVENGRIADTDAVRVRAALRAVVERFRPGVRLTPREDLLLTDVADADRAEVDAVLAAHGVVPAERWAPVKRNSFACPALPTCGLALTESERALPGVLDELHAELVALGLGDLDAHVRMTGCPNGCARPYTAEIGFVGRGKRSYDIHIGGEPVGVRLNAVFAENVPRDELVAVLRPLLAHYNAQRRDGERLGDFCHRTGVAELRAALGDERWVRAPRRVAAVVGGS